VPPRTPRDARRRALAQNFLVDDRAIAAIIGTVHPPPGGLVVDLGAGAGALTAPLAAAGARVLAVERDPHWARVLRSRAPQWGAVEVLEADLLTVPLPPGPHRVVSDAPFNLGTRLVRRLLTEAHGLQGAVLVLQRETARRLAGVPRAGRFAATWAPWFALAVPHTLPAAAFRPIPRVDAAVLTVVPREVPLLSPAAFGAYEAFVGALFAARGATLLDRLAGLPGGRARAALALAEVPRSATPGRVPPAAYAALFGALGGGEWSVSLARARGRGPSARAGTTPP
jgi:23S rRNA (adenine-N6)-dimethyltransferase